MALEDFCLVSGIGFILVYAVTLMAGFSIIVDQRKREMAMHRIRCVSKRRR